ncbi:MAG: YcnI family protein [Alicyclobacillaceae bacterium]|nr:YcnI family protein [Alicyclobacillaceae bacterium]
MAAVRPDRWGRRSGGCRWWAAPAAAAAVMLACLGTASAHVTVWPQTSTAGAWEKYTVRVPTEKAVPTVKIVLKIPQGVTFEQYEAVPGWAVTEQKDGSGRVTSVTWSATGGGIAPGQFQEFAFVAQNPKQPESLAWDAYQYYRDGSIVEWTGPADAASPHSITHIVVSPAAETTPAPAAAAGRSASAVWQWVMSVAALVLSVVAVALAVRRRG